MKDEITYDAREYSHGGFERYIVYRITNGKRKYLFGNVKFSELEYLLNNPEAIERFNNSLKWQGRFILALIIICSIVALIHQYL